MKNKFAVAITIYAVLAALSWLALSDTKLRWVTLALLAMFAFKTWIHHRKSLLAETQDSQDLQSEVKAAEFRRSAVR